VRRDYGDAVDRGLPFQLRALEGALAAAAAGLTEEAAALEARALPAADRLARRVRRPARLPGRPALPDCPAARASLCTHFFLPAAPRSAPSAIVWFCLTSTCMTA